MGKTTIEWTAGDDGSAGGRVSRLPDAGMTDPNAVRKPRITQDGHVYVTLAAAREYAEAYGLREEEARRELTESMLGAIWIDAGMSGVRRARARDRRRGTDITARVSNEPPMLVVVAIESRDLHTSLERKRRIVR